METHSPGVTCIEAVHTDADRTAWHRRLETFAILLQTHALLALTSCLVCYLVCLTTALLEFRVKRVGISLEDGADGMRADISMFLRITARDALASGSAQYAASKALAVSIEHAQSIRVTTKRDGETCQKRVGQRPPSSVNVKPQNGHHLQF